MKQKSLSDLKQLSNFEINKLFLDLCNTVSTSQVNPNISNEDKLKIYGLYKQSTVGDNLTDAPWSFQFKEKAKWDAHESNKGKPIIQAQIEYIYHVNKLL